MHWLNRTYILVPKTTLNSPSRASGDKTDSPHRVRLPERGCMVSGPVAAMEIAGHGLISNSVSCHQQAGTGVLYGSSAVTRCAHLVAVGLEP